jgi:hypothetical protein
MKKVKEVDRRVISRAASANSNDWSNEVMTVRIVQKRKSDTTMLSTVKMVRLLLRRALRQMKGRKRVTAGP